MRVMLCVENPTRLIVMHRPTLPTLRRWRFQVNIHGIDARTKSMMML
jgi:hypothetical protein